MPRNFILSRLKCIATRCTSALILAVMVSSVPASAAEIWMYAGPHVANPAPGWEGVRADNGDMWTPDAPWSKTAQHVRVVQFVIPNIERAKDDDLKQAFSDLKRRNISLAIGTGVIVRSERCRSTTEAYVTPGTLENLLDKVRRNGGEVKYLTMDEPFFWGHRSSGPTACHESAQALAKAVAESVRVVRTFFPRAQIGDDEVVDGSRPWVDDLAAWADAYHQATGERLAYIHADLDWKAQSVQNLVPLITFLKARGIPLGIIYDAAAKNQEPWFDNASQSNSDVGWTRNAASHYTKVESGLGIHPDHAVFSTWVHYPTHMLPETKPGTFTNLVLQYIQRRP